MPLEKKLNEPTTLFMMIDKIKEHIAKIEDFTAKTKEELEQFRIQYLGKKGLLNDFFAAFKEVPNEEKKDLWAGSE